MSTIFTDEQIASALLALSGRSIMTKPVPKKKHRSTIVKENRANALKAWHQMQRAMKERNAAKHRNRSNAMKAAWAKRKTQ
jgi:hypothetical protein